MNLPADIEQLSKYLIVNEDEIPLTDRVMSFFVKNGSDISCPELENYRQYLKERREKQSKGGKLGAEITNKARGRRQGTCESLVNISPVQFSKTQSVENEFVDDPFVDEYERTSNEF